MKSFGEHIDSKILGEYPVGLRSQVRCIEGKVYTVLDIKDDKVEVCWNGKECKTQEDAEVFNKEDLLIVITTSWKTNSDYYRIK